MNALFADTSCFVAYLNLRDEYHAQAVEWITASAERIVTSDWILAELGNYLAKSPNRRLLGPLFRALENEERFETVPADRASFLDALNLYMHRPDKSWSFTDCSSFCLMRARKIKGALTTDNHFQQAGFNVLLK